MIHGRRIFAWLRARSNAWPYFTNKILFKKKPLTAKKSDSPSHAEPELQAFLVCPCLLVLVVNQITRKKSALLQQCTREYGGDTQKLAQRMMAQTAGVPFHRLPGRPIQSGKQIPSLVQHWRFCRAHNHNCEVRHARISSCRAEAGYPAWKPA